jgi:hypothetical protein
MGEGAGGGESTSLPLPFIPSRQGRGDSLGYERNFLNPLINAICGTFSKNPSGKSGI